ncbi:hypothetical protein A9K97_gp074 [Tokyovirus A1]|uniref:hypothetical protein n=1 Tax=Tokyovirus A1 TaxID=1826170 RepID=UPI0007A98043|nr:hypothetical protein A9K97_gp074 [Tokyovirus A1]BAU80277.1 hypothetical protein [Tokyovirus A1]
MEEFLNKREALVFAVATLCSPKKERFLKFHSSKHREFWLLPNKKKHGPEKIFCGEVVTSERTWKNGLLHGEETLYTEKGRMFGMRTWRDGIRHGKTLRIEKAYTSEKWWENGELVYDKCTSDDLLHIFLAGTTTTYRKDGTISRIYSRSFGGIAWNFSEEGSVRRRLSNHL